MSDTDRLAALESQVADLARRVTVTEDELAIRKLQHLYGYLIDKCLYNETVDLFTPDGEVRFFGGVWKGQHGVRRLYVERFQARFTYGNNGPIDGFLLDHPQIQDIINVQPDGVTAFGRARSMMQAGRHKDYEGDAPHLKARQWWEGGIYENTYKKVDGTWRLHILNYMPQWHADFETGWAHTPHEYVPFPKVTYPTDPTGPDELITDHWLWPTHKLVPFHMPHPVTGEEIVAQRWQGDIDRENAKG
ncbi:nuclear transport factor 2 family protein [Novosphingobium lentum]|uniref:nuclear transport factor 2 family protein n=1 Tax=Novosphingobium lentum TaxID=145287 RepID=UPI00082F4B4B|nr:nuclear transport factor 2 family protein [Novosphingobium lentum]